MIGVVFVFLGLGIIVMDTEVSLRCVAAPPSGLNCQAARRILGVIPLAGSSVQGVTSARVDVNDAQGATPDQIHGVQRLVLRGRRGNTPLPWFSRRVGAPQGTVFLELEPFDRVANDITQLAEYGTAGEIAEYRHLVWTPLLVGFGFFIFGILALWTW
jgi:hypothetical protein